MHSPHIVAVLLLLCPLQLAADPHDIEIVSSWGELAQQPVITTSDKHTLRLGLSSYTGSLVTPPQLWLWSPSAAAPLQLTADRVIGPATLRIYREGGPRPLRMTHKERARHLKAERLMDQRGPRLYAALLRASTPGIYRIEVRDRQRTLLARTRIELLDRQEPAWFPLRRLPTRGRQLAQRAVPVRLRVEPRLEAALPCCGPRRPFAIGRFPALQPLPRLIPLAIDRTIRISTDGTRLKIRSQNALNPESSTHWLARWWVDGQPLTINPRQKRALEKQLMMISRRVKSIEFQLMKLDRIAGPRSRIEVQLLYCPEGWRRLAVPAHRRGLRMQKREETERISRPRLSCRLLLRAAQP